MHAALLTVALLATGSQLVSSNFYVADMAMTRMVELTSEAPYCVVYYDRNTIQDAVLNSDPKKVRQISNNLVADLEETCKLSRNKGKNQTSGGIMYPGTKWCGPGNTSKTYDDLGVHAAEDSCCREHDHCPLTISPQQCIRGICNTSPIITRSHCDCDSKLRRCLQVINTEVANTIGAFFFNVIQVTCFKERPPCTKWQRNGYTESEWIRICSQYNFQPSDKYVPLMPLNL